LKEVFEFLNNEIELKDQTVVAAISGGPDSMALLQILIEIRKNINLNIVCAHVNHKLRKESEQEKVMVENFCIKNNIIFEYMEINKYGTGNFHDQARQIRYDFFNQTVMKYNAKYLFTAHHGDDLIETILMRISRGSTLGGYSGFNKLNKVNNYYIVKPLIYVTKQQLLEYVEQNNIEYAIDKSNEKDVYTRNRYRKNILPFLKEENINIHKKYLQFSEELQKNEEFIKEELNKILPVVLSNNKLNVEKFKILNIVLKERIIEKMLQYVYSNNISLINNKHIKDILKLIDSNKPNISICLPTNKKAIKSYGYFEIKDEEINHEEYNYEFNNEITIDDYYITIVDDCTDKSNYIIRLNSEELTLPLYIRNIRRSDKMEVKGLNGSKKIKDIFINNKIPAEERKRFPILVDSNNKILWLPGAKKSKYDKSKNEKCDIIIKCIKKGGNYEKEN